MAGGAPRDDEIATIVELVRGERCEEPAEVRATINAATAATTTSTAIASQR